MRTSLASLVVLSLATPALAAEKPVTPAQWQAKIRDLPENTWIDTGVPLAYTGEVTIAYDSANHLLVRYGGCTRGRGNYEDYGYANDLWVLDCDAGAWMMRRAVHMYGGTGRPINGCGRATCYDAKRKVFWITGGVSSQGTGGFGDLGTYDAGADVFAHPKTTGSHGGPSSTMMAWCAKQDVLVKLNGTTSIFDMAKMAWREGAAVPPGGGNYRTLPYNAKDGLVILMGPCPKGWQPGQPKPRGGDREMRTWAYDPAADKWTDLAPKGQDAMPVRDNFQVDYDSSNHVLIALLSGSGDGETDHGKPSETWILDLAANAWKKAAPKAEPPSGLIKGSTAYDENHNVLFAYIAGQVWAYRYQGGCPKDSFASGVKN